MNDTALFLSFMLPGTMFLGLYDVLLRSLLKGGKVNERFLLGINFTGAGLLLLTPLFFAGIPELKPGFWIAYFGTLLLNIFGQWWFYKAFRHEEASLISPLRLLTPPLVLVTGFLLLGETPSFFGVMGIAVTIIGLFALLRVERKTTKITPSEMWKRSGVWYAVAGAVAFAFSFPLDKKAVVASSGIFFTTIILLGGGLVSILLSMRKNRITENIQTIRGNSRIVMVTVIIAAVGIFLATNSLQYALAAYASSIKRLLSFWAILFGGVLLKEKNLGAKIFAAVIMFAGIAITLLFK